MTHRSAKIELRSLGFTEAEVKTVLDRDAYAKATAVGTIRIKEPRHYSPTLAERFSQLQLKTETTTTISQTKPTKRADTPAIHTTYTQPGPDIPPCEITGEFNRFDFSPYNIRTYNVLNQIRPPRASAEITSTNKVATDSLLIPQTASASFWRVFQNLGDEAWVFGFCMCPHSLLYDLDPQLAGNTPTLIRPWLPELHPDQLPGTCDWLAFAAAAQNSFSASLDPERIKELYQIECKKLVSVKRHRSTASTDTFKKEKGTKRRRPHGVAHRQQHASTSH